MSNTAFLFPGQGAQYVGMGGDLAEASPACKALFDTAAEVLGYDLLELCTQGPEERVNATVHSQPGLYVSSLAALEQLKTDAPETLDACSLAAGLSLGEYTALAFAGALSFEDGLRLVHQRGSAMQDAADMAPSGMVSVLGLERDKVDDLCDRARDADVLQVANLLCPGNIVVSGHKAACERIVPLAEEAGAMKVIPLPVAGAFHTPLMQPALERLQAAVADTEIRAPRVPVVSNVDARPHSDPAEIRDLLVRQMTAPVLWEDSMRWMLDEGGVGRFYEIGPGKVLRGLMKRIARKTPFENIAG